MLKRYAFVFFLLLAAPPLAFAQGPQGLTSTVNGSTVVLTWSGGSGSYIVEAAVVPGGGAVATLPTAGTSLTVPGVPAGTYYVKVRDAGNGLVSNEVTVAVGGSTGCPGAPLPPALIVRSTGQQATVSWSSSGGCAPTSYTLFAGSAPGASDVTVVNAGGQLGLSAIAPPATYFVRVLGTNAFGSAVSQELTLRVAPNAQSDTVVPNGAVAFDVVMTQTGTLTTRLVWDDPTIDLDLYLTSPGCPYPPSGCLLEISDTAGTNSEAVSRPVVAGQPFRIWVDNFSQRTSSFTIFSTIAPGVSAASAAGESREESARPLQILKVKP